MSPENAKEVLHDLLRVNQQNPNLNIVVKSCIE
jgi:hypothetical protein